MQHSINDYRIRVDMPGKCACNLQHAAWHSNVQHFMHVQLTAPTWRSSQWPRESCTVIDKRRVFLIVLESQSVGPISKDETIRRMYLFQKRQQTNRVWIFSDFLGATATPS